MSFMIPPFDSVMHKTAGDNFNLFHSSERTVVECTFDEVDLRWGILWKRVGFTLANNARVIDACLRLHNFIVDFYEEVENTISPDHSIYDKDSRRFLATQAGIGGEESGVLGEGLTDVLVYVTDYIIICYIIVYYYIILQSLYIILYVIHYTKLCIHHTEVLEEVL